MNKKLFFLFTLLFGLVFINLYGYRNFSNATTTRLDDFSISGICESGISNIYYTEGINTNSTFNSEYTHTWNKSKDLNNMTMPLTAIRVKVTQLRDAPYSLIITDNTTNPKYAVPETVFDTPKARMAQYFKLDNFSLIQKVKVYLNFTTGLLVAGHFQIDFFNASDFSSGPINIGTYTDRDISLNFVGWKEFSIKEYFEPGEYYAVFTSWKEGIGNMNNNSWCINNYSAPIENKGASLFENTSGWFSIPDDSTADFLMTLDLTHYCSPQEVNLSLTINNQPVPLIHKRDYSVKTALWGIPILDKPVWKSEIMYYLDEEPITDFNVSITVNRTVAGGIVDTRGRYFYEDLTTGTFTANLSSTRWDVNYKKVNSSLTLWVFFRFPDDWRVSKFNDSYGMEIIEYGIMYSYIYGEYGSGIWIEEGGDGTQTFEYRASFTSPNYLTNTELSTKGLFSSQFSSAKEAYLGESFKIQTSIKNPEGELITNGNCSFYLYNSDGIQIDSSNKTNTNGVVTSNDIDTKPLGLGTYTMVIFWTNGEESGISVYQISINFSPLLITIIVAIIVAAATVVVLTYGRRKIAERNWIKSLHHLLVLSKKDGRPMYNYSFGIAIKDTALVSGMLSALTNFVKETTGSKKLLRVIDQEDKKIILSHGTQTTVAILSNKNLPIIRNRTQAFLSSFEEKYSMKMQKWTGDTSIFKGANKLVEEQFPISMDQKLINKAGFELQEFKERVQSAEDKSIITEILSKITNLIDQYQDLILRHYSDLINEIIKIAHEKLGENAIG